MIFNLALKNLIFDRIRFTITVAGILFAVVLVAVQLGLYTGSSRMITEAIDRSNAELWAMSYGTQSFEEGAPLLTGRERAAVLSVPGVAAAVPMVVMFADWHKPDGSFTNILVVGANFSANGLAPWNIVEGTVGDLDLPSAVAVDHSYLAELGVSGIRDRARINEEQVRISVLTKSIRSFTQSPFVFMTASQARKALNLEPQAATFLAIRLLPGADIQTVRSSLAARLSGLEILTTEEFTSRSLQQWLWNTGAGLALITGAILGLVVGTAIVSQTLYQSIKDAEKEFATLRAIGAKTSYLRGVVLVQASLSSMIGYALGMLVVGLVVLGTRDSALPVTVTPFLAAAILLLTLTMAALATIAAIVKVTRIDPATVFAR
jgi:putative ABC transport system permease protein